MITDLQKASLLKRLSAYILDLILLVILAVGFGWVLSMVMDYDAYTAMMDERYAYYEREYGVSFDITLDDYNALTDQQRANYDAANKALGEDEAALYAYNMMINQSLTIVSMGLLLSYLVLEFIVPLLLHNGQTIGKKVFSIAVMRVDGVRLTNLALFVRAVLGKYTIETMVPVFIVLMIILGIMGPVGTMIMIIFFLIQLALVLIRRDHGLIHDLIAGTVVVDMQSQMIFQTTEDLIAYKQRLHAEEARKRPY